MLMFCSTGRPLPSTQQQFYYSRDFPMLEAVPDGAMSGTECYSPMY